MTITELELRDHIETDLSTGAIARLIADAYAFCDERAGPAGEQTIVLQGGERYLILPKPITALADIDSITERAGGEDTVLVTADWRWNGGRILERLVNATPGYWGYTYGFAADVVVVYTPKPDTERRDRVVIDLCRLAIQHNALASERAGDYSSSSADYTAEREKIVKQLAPAMGVA